MNKPVSLSLYYQDADADGNIDGADPAVPGDVLEVYWLDQDNKLWVRITGSISDTDLKSVTAPVSHFSMFSLLGSGTSDLSSAYAFPVPYKPALHQDITFTDLSPACTIKVFTLSGELIKRIEHSGGSQEKWEDIDAGSGVYLYFIENDRDSKKGKLMIIR